MGKINKHKVPLSLQVPPEDLSKSLRLARRSISLGEYNLAGLIYYRILDITTLCALQQIAPFFGWQCHPYNLLKKDFAEHKNRLNPFDLNPFKEHLGFTDRLILLHLLLPEKITWEMVASIHQQADLRHLNWLIHGNRSITQTQIKNMGRNYTRVQRLLENMLAKEEECSADFWQSPICEPIFS